MLARLLQTGFVFLSLFSFVQADTCPTPEEIRDRKISKLYEWTVDENTSLDELLSVERLYAVRLMDYGEYVSCRYTTKKWPLRLDGKPEGNGCELTPETGAWTSTDSGHLVCREEDVAKCGFKIACNEIDTQ